MILALILSRIPDSAVTIRVEMTSNEGGTAELFVNGDKQWTQTEVFPGTQTISFTGIEGPIDILRIDPLAIADQHVSIHRISVFDSRDRQIATFAGPDFATWTTFNASNVVADEDGLSLTTSTSDTSVTSVVNVATGDQSSLITRLVQRWRKPWEASELVLGLPLLFLAVGAVLRWRQEVIVLLIGPVAVYLAIRLAGSTKGVTAADSAFGRPGWSGLDASYPRRFLMIALALSVGFALLGLVVRRLAKNHTHAPEAVNDSAALPEVATEVPRPDGWRTRARAGLRRVQWARLITIAAVPALYAAIRLPSAPHVTSSLTAPISSADWDLANLRTWDHFLATGDQPMVDFWYPYGNLGYLRLGLLGALAEWFGNVTCLAAISASLWRFAERATPVIIGTAAVAAFHLQFFSGGLRYLAPLAFCLWFATTRRTHGAQRKAALMAVAIAPLIAPDVGVYTFAAAVTTLVVDELTLIGLNDAARRKRLVNDCLAIGSGWCAFILIGLVRGSLIPSLALILDTQSTAAYVGAISPVVERMRPIPGRILLVFPFAALGLAAFATLRRRRRDLTLSWMPALAGLGMYGVLVLAKHLTRPGLQGVLAMICAAVVVVAIATTWQKIGTPTSALAAGTLLGALVIQAQAAESIDRWQKAINDTPSRVGELLAAATWDNDETLFYRATLTRDQLAVYQDEVAVADAVERLDPNGRIFVLGDAQYLYPLTGSQPYWIVSGWDASPLREQQRVEDELDADPPDIVVFDPRDIEFDGVPTELRLPLIHRWVIERYQPHDSVGSYELLIPRDPSSEIPWSYWRDMLGTTLDLGRLPAATTASGGSCDLHQSDAHCLAYLRIEVEPIDHDTIRTLTLSGPSGFFRLKFLQTTEDVELTVPVGRMWFWTPESNVFVPTDWTATYEIFGARDSVLY